MAPFYRARERLLARVNSKVVEQIMPLPENLTAARPVASVHV